MNKTARMLVLAGAATAVLTAGAAPAIAGEARTTGSYTNVRLAKVWGTPKGKDQCISTSGSVLVLRGCGKGSEQRWTLKGSKGLYTMKNKKSGKCAGVASTKSGTVVKQYSCNGSSKNQKWVLSGSTIISKPSGKALTAETSKSGRKLTITTRGSSNSKRIKQEWGTK
ncbi:RICIN domain-containing protein [Streptomyces sp. NBC_01387]|uniref:RICIN domain-containing protein n=1 Tax=unclassified Streptomyces TaxID=2593676 RepID=UPI00202583C5|nr:MULTISPECIES: RICIN domain-containing protein [unclassified Streptomyces]MCX4549889.1 RICIN domain-containing protein [Streptomyces sp. NBC_01500]WSC21411.1 RICIN domain-containing protein [Streptomyces sp. NBC_01766]WSV55341.1 RICIN domain-containing protein [Streptomyces sp. NBC_01014]